MVAEVSDITLPVIRQTYKFQDKAWARSLPCISKSFSLGGTSERSRIEGFSVRTLELAVPPMVVDSACLPTTTAGVRKMLHMVIPLIRDIVRNYGSFSPGLSTDISWLHQPRKPGWSGTTRCGHSVPFTARSHLVGVLRSLGDILSESRVRNRVYRSEPRWRRHNLNNLK